MESIFLRNLGANNNTMINQNYHPLNCTLATCPLEYAYLMYDPTLAGNALFLAIFSLLLPIQIYLGYHYRTSGVLLCMFLGLSMEIIGYVGRIRMHFNPFVKSDFLMELIPLTIGPVFMAAAVYLCLARIVVVYGERLSMLKPRTYTLLFCCCDFFSLALQAIGSAIAAVATKQSKIQLGANITISGLSVQVASLALFISLSLSFLHRIHHTPPTLLNPHHTLLRTSLHFHLFLLSLALATLCIFTRSLFRVIELSGGFAGKLANNEVSYMVLEGAMIVLSSTLLTVMHPGLGFGRRAWEEGDWKFGIRREREVMEGGPPLVSEEWRVRRGVVFIKV